MDPVLFSHLNNYSISGLISAQQPQNIEFQKTIRLACKDREWPELHTAVMAGYVHDSYPFGFDGYDIVNDKYCEVKSSSKILEASILNKITAGEKKLKIFDSLIDGRGIFSQLNLDRYNKHLTANTKMLISSYINGILMFIIEFPFSHETFAKHIKDRLDSTGASRNVSFAYTSYKDCQQARLVYLTREENRQILKLGCTKQFYHFFSTLKRR